MEEIPNVETVNKLDSECERKHLDTDDKLIDTYTVDTFADTCEPKHEHEERDTVEDRGIQRHSDKDKYREKHVHKEKDRDKDKFKDRVRHKEKNSDRQKGRYRHKDKNKYRDTDRCGHKLKDRDRDGHRVKHRDRDRYKDRDRENGKHRSRDKRRHKDKDRDRDKGRHKYRDGDGDRDRGRGKHKVRHKDKRIDLKKGEIKHKDRDRETGGEGDGVRDRERSAHKDEDTCRNRDKDKEQKREVDEDRERDKGRKKHKDRSRVKSKSKRSPSQDDAVKISKRKTTTKRTKEKVKEKGGSVPQGQNCMLESSLSREEVKKLRRVIKKDEVEMRAMDQKVSVLRNEIEKLRQLKGERTVDSCPCCCTEFSSFWTGVLPFLDTGTRCQTCKYRVCKACRYLQPNGMYICRLCVCYRQPKTGVLKTGSKLFVMIFEGLKLAALTSSWCPVEIGLLITLWLSSSDDFSHRLHVIQVSFKQSRH
ncbi:nipped-b-like protein b [Plakobranchus ocellatus]|uniref:Nipped-b-like protein b n=1 Tax=Plakobranchus ocellatus TaxID=259542 RepID=A0AAV4BH13_9GAST|nr:nipped-b-like protein b [Plakobranchus ocellatus]